MDFIKSKCNVQLMFRFDGFAQNKWMFSPHTLFHITVHILHLVLYCSIIQYRWRIWTILLGRSMTKHQPGRQHNTHRQHHFHVCVVPAGHEPRHKNNKQTNLHAIRHRSTLTKATVFTSSGTETVIWPVLQLWTVYILDVLLIINAFYL